MKKYLLFACLPLIALLFQVVGFPSQASAFDPFRNKSAPNLVCKQTDSEGNKSTVCAPSSGNPLTGPTGVINRIANIFALITGIAAVIFIIIGGFEYVRSGGESAKVNKAKNTIIYAIIGLVVVVIARSIVGLAVSKL